MQNYKNNKTELSRILTRLSAQDQNLALKKYITKYPEDWEGYCLLGMNYLKWRTAPMLDLDVFILRYPGRSSDSIEKDILENLKKAEKCFEALSDKDTGVKYLSEYKILLTGLYYPRPNYQVIVDKCTRLLESINKNLKLYNSFILLMGIAQRETEHFSLALEYILSIDIDKFPTKWAQIGLTYLMTKDYKNAISAFDKITNVEDLDFFLTFRNAISAESENNSNLAKNLYSELINRYGSDYTLYFYIKEMKKRVVKLKTNDIE